MGVVAFGDRRVDLGGFQAADHQGAEEGEEPPEQGSLSDGLRWVALIDAIDQRAG
jgi:hypothetical protein